MIMVMLDESTFEAFLSYLGPIQSSPVALVDSSVGGWLRLLLVALPGFFCSSFDKNFLTKGTIISGILKYVSGWTLNLHQILVYQSQLSSYINGKKY